MDVELANITIDDLNVFEEEKRSRLWIEEYRRTLKEKSYQVASPPKTKDRNKKEWIGYDWYLV
jgi:hypothetical protein